MFRSSYAFAALAATAGLAAGAAHAEGQVTFYSWANFGGTDLTVTDSSRDFNISGAAPESMLVRSGRWQICSQPDFRGRCRIVEPGEYPQAGQHFGHIASAREVSTIAEPEVAPRRYWAERPPQRYYDPRYYWR